MRPGGVKVISSAPLNKQEAAMKSNERELIINLIKLFKEMYDIIVSNPKNDINYAKKTIKNIVQYLEMELANDTLGYEELVSKVAGQYKSMFPPRGGLSEFYIWDNSYEVRYRANHEYYVWFALNTALHAVLKASVVLPALAHPVR